MRAAEIHPGDLIAGKYRVRAILGRNHGLLVEAFHTEFDQRVVIKVLLAGSGDEREIERFRRESRVLAKLGSEHAARIIDVGTEPGGSFYLVREYLDGVDLGAYVQQQGALPLVDAVLCVLQVAECVTETHSHGIIVRELAPSHLFLTQRPGGAPCVKISDFGTAKLMNAAAAPGVSGELTATAMFGLSPYSSPELLRKARNVDARTDVWSLGAIFYELVTGRPPFAGDMTQLMLAISREEPTPASHLVRGLPPEIDQIIAWALAKDVDARFKNVHAFAHALLPYASPEGQVLIERIAQISERARAQRRGGSAPPPPPSFPSTRAPAQPVAIAAQPVAPAHAQMAPRAIDESLTDVRIPKAPPIPGARSVPPPPAGQPMGTVPAAMASPTAPPISAAPRPAPMAAGRKLAIAVLAVSAVLVPLLVVLLVLKRSAGPAVAEKAAATVTATAPSEPVKMGGDPPNPPAQPAAPASASAEPVAATAAPSATEAAEAPSAAPSASASAEPSAKLSSKTSRAAAPSPAPPPPATNAGGAPGTLLAVAVGGSCAFQVNGASKGNGSSLRLSLKPGTYSIVCRPPTGATKSKSVTVRSGETAMAAFKL